MIQLKPAALALMFLLMAACLAGPAQAGQDSQLCAAEVARQERQRGIPDGLLSAISVVESGRWDAERRASFAWPWTVMAEGEGRFLPSKEEAVAEVKKLKARGVRNIDVGCMQVNLRAHPDAFDDIESAFDPATNVGYAARFLTGLYEDTKDWRVAGSYYHSQTPHLAAAYRSKLMAAWEKTKGRQAGPEDPLMLAMFEPPVFKTVKAPVREETPDMRKLRQDRLVKAAEAKAALDAERAEAKRIADAYRSARLAEYRMRKAERAALLEKVSAAGPS